MSFQSQDNRAFVERVVEDFNPGVTLLVLIWTVAFALRTRLTRLGMLNQIGDEALRSLVYVIPIMLVGWGILAAADRRYRLGLFRNDTGR